MNWNAVKFDWNQVRAFLATVEEGSLSGAARALGATQPTLSRQISSLEEDLGVILFERSKRSMTITEAGLMLLEQVNVMGEAAFNISRIASGQVQAIEGSVSITAGDMTATIVLPEVIRDIQQANPQLRLELVASNEVRDLQKREADIAIRHVRPEQPDLIAKLAGTSRAQLFASKDFIQKHNCAERIEELVKLPFVGLDNSLEFIPLLKKNGLNVEMESFKIMTTSGSSLIELVKQGSGISILPKYIADKTDGLINLVPEFSIPIPVWLVTHSELRTSGKIRLVYDALAKYLESIID